MKNKAKEYKKLTDYIPLLFYLLNSKQSGFYYLQKQDVRHGNLLKGKDDMDGWVGDERQLDT